MSALLKRYGLDHVDNVVFTCGSSDRDGRYYVYYGGADTVIGVATIDRDELIAFARHGEPWRG